MARSKGTAIFAVNFEPTGQSPLDARLVVGLKSDLTNEATYADNNIYNGMVVAVLEDNSLYMLTNMSAVTEEGSWKRIDAGSSEGDISGIHESITNIEGDITEINSAITANKVASSGKTITVATAETGTNIEVNIDGKTITKDENGVLSVDFTAMVEVPTGDTGGTEQKPVFSIVKVSDEEGYAATYELQTADGTALGTKIQVPVDMVVSSGTVAEVTTAETPYAGAVVGDKYIDLTIANNDGTHIYIPVKDLTDVYTAGHGIEVSDSNVISAKVVSGDKYITVDATGIHVKPTTGSTSGNTAIDDAIATAVDTAKEELQAAIDALESGATADKAAMVTAVTADTTQPISAVTADSESGKTVTLSFKLAAEADQANMKAAAFADNDDIEATMLENRLMLTADGKAFIPNIIDGGVVTV